MNNGFDALPSAPKVNLEDVSLFGQLLTKLRSVVEKTRKQIALDLNIKEPSIVSWEDGTGFPSEDKLLNIAEAYGAEVGELKKALNISREARKLEKEFRRPPERFKIVANPNSEVDLLPDRDRQRFRGTKF